MISFDIDKQQEGLAWLVTIKGLNNWDYYGGFPLLRQVYNTPMEGYVNMS